MATSFTSGTVHTYSANTWAFSDVVAGADGKFYMAHKADGGGGIKVLQWNGTAWVERASFTAAQANAAGIQDDLDLVVDASGKLHIVFRSYTGSGVTSDRGVAYGTFNGTSWSFSKIESASDPNGWKNYDDPSLAIDANGAAHVVYNYSEAATHTDYVKYATNAGGTWATQILVTGAPGTGTDETHEPWVGIGADGMVNVTFIKEDSQNDYNGNLYISTKTPGGSFTSPTKIINAVGERFDYLGQSSMDVEGKIHNVFYQDVVGADGNLISSTIYDYTNASGTWVKQAIISSTTSYLGAVGYQDTGSTEYLLIQEYGADFSLTGARIYYRHQGGAWKAGNAVTLDPTASETAMAVGADGTVMIITEDNGLRNVTYLTGDAGAEPVDNIPPAAPSAPDLETASDTGASSTDNLTNDTTPTFIGSGAEADATVRLYANGTLVGSAKADGSGNWSVTASALSHGSHTITARIVDQAGNESADSPTLSFRIDAVAPAAPSAIDLTADSDTGLPGIDKITTDKTPTFSGLAEAGAIVRLYADGAEVGSTTADSLGNWTITASTLSSGTYRFTSRVEDAAGNLGSVSSDVAVTIDTVAPVMNPATSGPADNASNIDPNSDIVLRFDEPVELGTGGSIILYNVTDGVELASIPFNSSLISGWGTGAITIDPSFSLPEGKTISISWTSAVFRDKAGNFVAANATNTLYNFTVKEPNVAPEATHLTQTITFVEDVGVLSLDDIVVTDSNSIETITAKLTLSDPAAGRLTVGTFGSATAAYDATSGVWTVTGSVANVNAALAAVQFVPSANWDRSVTIATQIRDAAETGPTNGVITLNATPVNDAPRLVSADLPLTVAEGAGAPTGQMGCSVADLLVGFSDVDTGHLRGIAVTGANTAYGTWWFSIDDGDTWLPLDNAAPSAAYLIGEVDGRVYFQPSGDYAGTVSGGLTIRAWDMSSGANGGTADTTMTGGSTAFSTGSDTVDVMVTPVNDAPAVTVPSSFEALEDEPTAITGIVIADPDAGSDVVSITLTVTNGTLLANTATGISVIGNGSGSVTLTGTVAALNNLIAGSNISFQSALNASGTVKVTVTVNDLGNSGASGPLTDEAEFDIAVSPVNDAPTSADGSVSLLEDGQYTFRIADFVFADASDALQNVLMSIVIESLPSHGRLTLDGATILPGHEIPLADIGKLVFTPDENESGHQYCDFTFRVKDNGGTEEGGNDTSVPYTMRIDVTSVNDAPLASNRNVAIDEDATYTFHASDFDFVDTDGASPKAVIITKLPTDGRLMLDGVDVTQGQPIDLADLEKLTFTPADDAFGAGYASFKFKVQDNGGTANGGKDVSVSEYSFSIDVDPVNDDPSGINDGPVFLIERDTVSATAEDGVLANDTDIDVDDLEVIGISYNGATGAVGSEIAGGYGKLTLNMDGSYTYVADPVTQAMPAGQTVTDVFTYTLSDGNGGTKTASITFQIDGRNDVAIIGGGLAGTVTEDGTQTASGVLIVSDIDQGEEGFLAQSNVQGTYGTFSFDHLTGEWSYVLENDSRAVQALREGEIKHDTFTVKSSDGTEQVVRVAVNGTKDPDVIDGIDVDRTETINGNGAVSQVVTIPVVTGSRGETSGDVRYADIPIVAVDSRSVLTVQLGIGIGLTASGFATPKAAGSSLADLIHEIRAHTMAGSVDQSDLTGGGSGFLESLPTDKPIIVQTIVVTQSGVSSGVPLVIIGSSDPNAPATALVIDAKGLVAGTTIELQNVAFATIIGNVRVTGGAGSQVVYGDSASQHIVLGADDDTLHGGAGDDYVGSEGGNDWLYGDAGNDTISGGIGADRLDGGTGDDLLIGGTGHDIYIVDSAGDRIVESNRAGTDIVYASVSYRLAAYVENLVLLGDAAYGYGNSLGNVLHATDHGSRLYSSGGNDTLYGGNGADGLHGSSGNDKLYGSGGRDYLSGSSGNDRLDGGAGNDSLSGGSGNDILRGGDGRDSITGGSGDDVIYGGLGADVIDDGYGRDTIVFNTRLGRGEVDRIKNFNVGPDTIRLENAIFKGVGGRGWLDPDAFHIGRTAANTSDRIIYDDKKGVLYYDADGSGSKAQVAFATLSKHLKMTEKDFFII